MIRTVRSALPPLLLLCSAHALLADEAARPEHATPFGALSLIVLAGTLAAGIAGGAVIAAWLVTRTQRRAEIGEPTASQATASAAPQIQDPPFADEASAAGRHSEEEDTDVPVAFVDLDGSEAGLEDWIAAIANGPRFGPRLVGVLTADGCDSAEALACLADAARATDRDVAIVDAAGDVERVAAALDRRCRPAGHADDVFGAAAQVEIVPLSDLVPHDRPLTTAGWRDSFETLAAHVDIILVDLPALGEWAHMPSFLAVLDDVILLRRAGAQRQQIETLAGAAKNYGAPITGHILIDRDAA